MNEYRGPNSRCPDCQSPALTMVHDDGSWMSFCETCQLIEGRGPTFELAITELPPEWAHVRVRRARPDESPPAN